MTTLRSTRDSAVGLLPAAGHARRLAMAAGSKELMTVPDLDGAGGTHVPVSEYLVRQYRAAGVIDVVLARREAKRDLAEHFASVEYTDLAVHDLVVEPTPGSAHTLSLAASSVPDRTVVAGFPDIMLIPPSLARDALVRLAGSGADVCLAHVSIPAHERGVWDMSTFDGARVVGLDVRPDHLVYDVAWTLAAWRPTFTVFLASWIAEHDASPASADQGEVSLTHALLGAIATGMHVTSIVERGGFALDIGQPERLAAARALLPAG